MEDLGTLKSHKIDLTLTEIEDKYTRSSVEYWKQRVQTVGNHKSPFLDMSQKKIDSFTERHREWVIPRVQGKDAVEIGCGYGRNMDMFKGARTYRGMDCVLGLVREAEERFNTIFGPDLETYDMETYRGHISQVDLRTYDFGAGSSFDICVGIAVISSVESYFYDLCKRIMMGLRSGGVILWLEETYTRIDYK